GFLVSGTGSLGPMERRCARRSGRLRAGLARLLFGRALFRFALLRQTAFALLLLGQLGGLTRRKFLGAALFFGAQLQFLGIQHRRRRRRSRCRFFLFSGHGRLGLRGGRGLDGRCRRRFGLRGDSRRFGRLGRQAFGGIALHEHALFAHFDLNRARLAAGIGLLDFGGLFTGKRDLVLGLAAAVRPAQVVEQLCLVLFAQYILGHALVYPGRA